MLKVCPRCKLSTDNFYNNKSRKDGLDSICKDCRRLVKREYYASKAKEINRKHWQWFKSLEEPKKAHYKESARRRQKLYRHKRSATEASRRFAKENATPKWLSKTQVAEIETFYWMARDLKSVSGQEYHVDHIVPLKGENICGLHVPWNLQILPADLNIAKSNSLDMEKYT